MWEREQLPLANTGENSYILNVGVAEEELIILRRKGAPHAAMERRQL